MISSPCAYSGSITGTSGTPEPAERTIYEVGKKLAARGHEFHLASVNPGHLPRE